jgi:hypothetical protein
MSEQLLPHEPLAINPEKLQRIANQVAKLRYMRQLDEEMADNARPDIIGLQPQDYDTDQEIHNTVWNALPRGSSREDVDTVLSQIDQLIEDGGGLETYLAAETARRTQKEADLLALRRAEQESSPANGEATPGPQAQEAPESHDPSTRRSFGRSILTHFRRN